MSQIRLRVIIAACVAIFLATAVGSARSQRSYFTGFIESASGEGEQSIQLTLQPDDDSVAGNLWYSRIGEDMPSTGAVNAEHELVLRGVPAEGSVQEFRFSSPPLPTHAGRACVAHDFLVASRLEGSWKEGKRTGVCHLSRKPVELPEGVKLLETVENRGSNARPCLVHLPRFDNPHGLAEIGALEELCRATIEASIPHGDQFDMCQVAPTLEFANAAFVSIVTHVTTVQKGSHNAVETATPLSFDMGTGRILTLSRLFADSLLILRFLNDQDSIALLDSGGTVRSSLRFASRSEAELRWMVTPDGIAIIHDARDGLVPNVTTVIPYSKLRPFYLKRSPLKGY